MEKEIKEQKAEKEGRCVNNKKLWLPFLGSSVITMCCCS